MVLPEIWKAAGMGVDDGNMCIGCLEDRIGRELTRADFTNAPINEPSPWNTPRLASRLLEQTSAMQYEVILNLAASWVEIGAERCREGRRAVLWAAKAA